MIVTACNTNCKMTSMFLITVGMSTGLMKETEVGVQFIELERVFKVK